MSDEFRNGLKSLTWVNWSDIAREEARKKIIFENYMKKGKITDEEWKFCEKIDWHPVDEIPMKESHLQKISEIMKEKPIKFKNVSDIFK